MLGHLRRVLEQSRQTVPAVGQVSISKVTHSRESQRHHDQTWHQQPVIRANFVARSAHVPDYQEQHGRHPVQYRSVQCCQALHH